MRRVSWNCKTHALKREITPSRLAWGVWVEIVLLSCNFFFSAVTPRMRRVSWNFNVIFSAERLNQSRLAWGVWVEMKNVSEAKKQQGSHASHEACELKSIVFPPLRSRLSHASHEACELKSFWTGQICNKLWSRLAWGVWVEILLPAYWYYCCCGHASHEACELKFQMFSVLWACLPVTPRMRRVSWNRFCYGRFKCVPKVTPRMRRVSWNLVNVVILVHIILSRLAWGVWVEMSSVRTDGNTHFGHASHEACELKYCTSQNTAGNRGVTPRMRRVSWNLYSLHLVPLTTSSRLAWGVWVEIIIHADIISAFQSRLAWGVWVEISCSFLKIRTSCRHASHEACELKSIAWWSIKTCAPRHASHEACELKCRLCTRFFLQWWSRLAWGVWVEIFPFNEKLKASESRLAWGVWVEMHVWARKPGRCM